MNPDEEELIMKKRISDMLNQDRAVARATKIRALAMQMGADRIVLNGGTMNAKAYGHQQARSDVHEAARIYDAVLSVPVPEASSNDAL